MTLAVGLMIVGGVVATVGVAMAPYVLGAIGFTSAGIAAGSLAASWQGPAVAAGSWFAATQGFAATGCLGFANAASVVAAGTGVGGLVGTAVDLLPKLF